MKLSHMMIILFLILVGVIGVSFAFFVNYSSEQLLDSVRDSLILVVVESIERIDQDLHAKIDEIKIFTTDLVLKETLASSNLKFSKLENPKQYINQIDEQWRVQNEKIIPLINEISQNELSKELTQRVEGHKTISGYSVYGEIFVTNSYGATVAQTGITTDYKQDDEKWWIVARDEELYVGDVVFDESAGVYSTDIAVRIDDDDGNFLGVIKAVPNIENIVALIDQISDVYGHVSHEMMVIKLLDSKGRIIYATDKHGFLDNVVDDIWLEIKSSRGSFMISDPQTEKLYAYAVSKGFSDFEGLDWVLLFEHDTFEILAPIETLTLTGMIVLVISVATVSFFGAYLTRSISRPLKLLGENTQKIAKGDYDVKLEKTGTDEIITLSKSFENMATAIKESRKKLEDYSKTIEIQLDELKILDKQKDEFSAVVSHELKTPLVPLKGYAEMLLEDDSITGPKNKREQEILESINRNATRLGKLVDKILLAQKIGLLQLEWNITTFDLGQFMDDVTKNNLPLMKEKQIRFTNSVTDSIQMDSDQDKLSEVFSNLIQNAVDFVPERGTITIGAILEDDAVLFYTRDNGSGIPLFEQEKIFKKYYQTDTSMTRAHGGVGLGLTICRGIVNGLGGKIWVESVDKGSTFFFRVPKKYAGGRLETDLK